MIIPQFVKGDTLVLRAKHAFSGSNPVAKPSPQTIPNIAMCPEFFGLK